MINFIFWQYSTFPYEFPKTGLGGAETAIYEIAKRIAKKYPTKVFCIGDKDLKKEIKDIEFNWIKPRFQNKWIKPDLYFRKIFKNINDKEFIQAVNCIEPAFYSKRSYLHLENEQHPYMPFPKIKARFYTNFLKNFNKVTGVSNYVTKNFIYKFHFPEQKTGTIFNGADVKLYNPNKSSLKLLRKHDLKKTDFKVIFSGRITERKGLHYIFKTIKDTDIKLFVAGETDNKAYEKELLKDYSPNIMMLGNLSKTELAKYYASSDLCVVPSIWQDPCPLVTAEAMASGLPVIAFDNGGLPELVTEDVGFCISPDVLNLKKHILMIREDNQLKKKLSHNALKKARNELNWDIIYKEFLKIYDE